MKNMLLIPVFIFLLGSCAGDMSACDCAQMTVDAISETFKNTNISQEEGKKLYKQMEERLAPCNSKIELDDIFKKEFEKCLKEKMNN
tara:strand:- start:128 stop:388 length:261 start_codon:yes stop_codon:yes gene_type:complete